MGRKIKDLAKKIGLNPENIAGHSWRKGGAQWAVKNNLPATAIMKQADWKSFMSLKRYYDNIDRLDQVEIFKNNLKSI